jgi:hypothetical protein
MRLAIDLNRELQHIAVEVGDVRSDRILPSELPITEAAVAKPAPDDILGERRLLSKFSCALGYLSIVFVHISEVTSVRRNDYGA